MNEDQAKEQGYEVVMRFKLGPTRLDMAGAFFGWINEWCRENDFGESLVGWDHEGYTTVLVKVKQYPEAPQSNV